MGVLKRHSLAFVSFVMFLLLRLRILTWISESMNLLISTQHHYSAQFVFDMHEFKLFPFIDALNIMFVFAVKKYSQNARVGIGT